MERELTVERTRAGLQTARLQGRVGGRRRLMTEGRVTAAQELLRSGRAPRDVAADLGVSLATLYRWVPAEDRLNAPQPDQSVPLLSNDADNLVSSCQDRHAQVCREVVVTDGSTSVWAPPAWGLSLRFLSRDRSSSYRRSLALRSQQHLLGRVSSRVPTAFLSVDAILAQVPLCNSLQHPQTGLVLMRY